MTQLHPAPGWNLNDVLYLLLLMTAGHSWRQLRRGFLGGRDIAKEGEAGALVSSGRAR